jgi:hypothetical protein
MNRTLLLFTAAAAAASLMAAMTRAAPVATSLGVVGDPPPAVACTGRAPTVGQAFRGAVLQVIDGRTLCVARGPSPKDWLRVRVSGVPEYSSRRALMAASFGQVVSCTIVSTLRANVEARCTIDGRPLD